jgi:DHA3 family macrolide efflux protein-like MFS transporter
MSSAAINPPEVGAPEPLSIKEVLGLPVMRRLWYAQMVSNFGDFLALFAVISVLTYKLNGTPQQVNGLQIAYLLPIAVLSILAGVFVDRWPLKTTLVASDFTRAGLCLLLLLSHTLWSFYLVLAAISVVSSFFGPAQGVALRTAVPPHGLRSANTLMQQVTFGLRIIGPALSAVLVARFGAKVCYWADAASFVASGSLIASLALTRETAVVVPGEASPETKKSGLASILPDMKQGIGFILGHAALLFVMTAFAAGMFVLGCFGPLIAVYVRDSLHASTKTFGAASAMIGLGLMMGAQLVNTAGKRLKNTTLVLGGLGGIAVGLCLLTFLPFVWSTILANLFIGMAVAGIVVPATTLMQQETPAELMGRVGSAVMSLIFTAQIAGLALSGTLANHIGVRHVFAVCAMALGLLIVAGKLFLQPKHDAPTPAAA